MARNSEKNILFISVWPSYVARVQVQSLISPIKEHGTYTAMQKKNTAIYNAYIHKHCKRWQHLVKHNTDRDKAVTGAWAPLTGGILTSPPPWNSQQN